MYDGRYDMSTYCTFIGLFLILCFRMSENSYDTRSRASVSSYGGQSYQQVWDPLAQLHILDLLVAEIQQLNVQVVGTPEDLVNVHSQLHYILHD